MKDLNVQTMTMVSIQEICFIGLWRVKTKGLQVLLNKEADQTISINLIKT